MLFADHGAEVVKVEPPEGDPARARPGFHVWNRGKRAVIVDRDHAGDVARLMELSSRADVIFVGTERPGFTYDDMKRFAINRTLPLTVILPPYLLGHTPWAGEREADGLLNAYLGHTWNQASYRNVPVDCIYPLSLYLQGSWAATVAAACLLDPAMGRGQTVAVGGAHGALLASPGMFIARRDERHVHRPGGPGGSLPTYRCYRCQDGTWLFLGAFTNAFIERAILALGASDIMEDSRIQRDPGAIRNVENIEWVIAHLERIFQQRSRADWLTILNDANVPVAPVLSHESWLDHIQIEALGQRLCLADDDGKEVVMPGVSVCLEDTPGAVRSVAPSVIEPVELIDKLWRKPRESLNAHGNATANDVARPLRGIRAIDLGTIIAGPYVGMLLAELGADVVKVERPPLGDEYRLAHGGRGGSAYPAYNRGQRSLAVDLRKPDGRDLLEKLIGRSDVLIDNFRPGVVERLGIDRATLRETNPTVISLSISAFGNKGPLGFLPGFDPVIQAMSGMMRAQAGPDESDSPVFLTVPINDVMAAVLSTFGVCLAMFVRRTTGLGQGVSVPLAAVSCLVQSEQLVRVAGRKPCVVGGRDFAGPSPFERLYATSDGFIRLDASGEFVPHGLRAAGFIGDDPRTTSDERLLVDALSTKIAALRTGEAIERLGAVGLSVVRVRTFDEVVSDPILARQGVINIVSRDEAGNATAVEPGRGHHVPGSHISPLRDAPRYGEHSREILAELGVECERIEELVSGRVVFSDD